MHAPDSESTDTAPDEDDSAGSAAGAEAQLKSAVSELAAGSRGSDQVAVAAALKAITRALHDGAVGAASKADMASELAATLQRLSPAQLAAAEPQDLALIAVLLTIAADEARKKRDVCQRLMAAAAPHTIAAAAWAAEQQRMLPLRAGTEAFIRATEHQVQCQVAAAQLVDYAAKVMEGPARQRLRGMALPQPLALRHAALHLAAHLGRNLRAVAGFFIADEATRAPFRGFHVQVGWSWKVKQVCKLHDIGSGSVLRQVPCRAGSLPNKGRAEMLHAGQCIRGSALIRTWCRCRCVLHDCSKRPSSTSHMGWRSACPPLQQRCSWQVLSSSLPVARHQTHVLQTAHEKSIPKTPCIAVHMTHLLVDPPVLT